MSFHLRRPLAATLSESNHSAGQDLSRAGQPAALIALAIALAALFGIGLAQPGLPGLQYDEAADAVPAMEMITGQPLSSLSVITLFGRQFPLMMLHHIGPTTIFTSFIGLSLFGVSVEALRLTQLIVGAIALILLWRLARAWFDNWTALFAALLCGTAPVFIWWSRAGANWTVPLLPLSLAMLMALWRWRRTGQATALIVAAFLFGAGVTTKILFVWLVAPLGLMALITLRRDDWRKLPARPLTWLAALLAMSLGMLPLILHNLPNGDTIRFVLGNAFETRIYGHNNLEVLKNLSIVATEFLRAMGGDTLHFQSPPGLPLGAIAFIGSMVWLLARAIADRRLIRGPAMDSAAREARLRLFLLLCVCAILPLSTISTSGIGATYLFILVPLAWLIVAVALRDGMRWLGSRIGARRAAVAGAVALAAVLVSHIAANAQTIQHFNVTGGKGAWSDAIFAVARALDTQYAGRPMYALDWGFARNVSFLTLGRAQAQEIYEFQPIPSPAFTDMARVTLQEPGSLYLAHPPGQAAFPRYWQVFERQAQLMHKQLIVEQAFTERDGTPYAFILTASEAPRNFTLPVTASVIARDALFDDALMLLGGEVSYDAGAQEVALSLYWEALTANLPDDTVLVHVVNQNTGEVVLAADQQPFEGHYPFSHWVLGEVVTDVRWVSLPAGLPPGIYQIRIGVYNTLTGERRHIQDPLNDAAGDSLMLDTFEIP